MKALIGSRPARGAWVEIFAALKVSVNSFRRAPHGARGLKFLIAAVTRCLEVAPRKGRVG